jgi:hypothetical protein
MPEKQQKSTKLSRIYFCHILSSEKFNSYQKELFSSDPHRQSNSPEHCDHNFRDRKQNECFNPDFRGTNELQFQKGKYPMKEELKEKN